MIQIAHIIETAMSDSTLMIESPANWTSLTSDSRCFFLGIASAQENDKI